MANIITGLPSGYNGVQQRLRQNVNDVFTYEFQPVNRFIGLRRASIEAAHAVRASTDKEICVLYSGGLDSEWALEAFRLANIPVTAVVITYADGLNDHDTLWAKAYLERHKHASVIWHPLNLREWYKSQEQKDLAWRVQTPELAYTGQFKTLLDLHNGQRAFITGYDEPLLVADDSACATGGYRTWSVVYEEKHNSVVKLFHEFGLDGVTNWSRSSAELIAAFITQPQWQMLAANLYQPQIWNSELVKVQMFQSHFPEMRARTKYTGFEKANDFIVNAAKDWQAYVVEQTGQKWSKQWTSPVEDVWRTIGFHQGAKTT